MKRAMRKYKSHITGGQEKSDVVATHKKKGRTNAKGSSKNLSYPVFTHQRLKIIFEARKATHWSCYP